MVICVTKVSAMVIEALYSLHVEPVHSTLFCHWTLPFLLLWNRVTKIILYINNNNNHFLTTLSSKSTSTRSKYEIEDFENEVRRDNDAHAVHKNMSGLR